MRYLIPGLWLYLFLPVLHAQWIDHFESGFDSSWIGDRSDFIINSDQELQLSATAGGSSILLHSFQNSDSLIWTFYFKLDFSPSSSNRLNIILASDRIQIDSAYAYILKIGENGNNDNWKFYINKFTSDSLIAEGLPGKLSSDPVTLRMNIKKSKDNNWTFQTDYSGGHQYSTEQYLQSVTDLNIVNPFFGFQCFYSDTRKDKFLFDDIAIDTIEEKITEPIAQASRLDLLITEIMADPDPAVGLPNKEYVEIKNVSNHKIDLTNCILSDATTTSILPHYQLDSGAYLILCDVKDSSLFKSFGSTIGVNHFPSLNNAGDKLRLQNKNQEIIFEVDYDDSWYHSSQKKVGGYSLEMINTGKPCAAKDNWTASIHFSGGTPGKENSVSDYHKDLQGPLITDTYALNDSLIQLQFNESLNPLHPIRATITPNLNLSSPNVLPTINNEIQIMTSEKLLKGISYKMTLDSVGDCLGNISDTLSANFALPEEPSYNELVWSEILFNPNSGGSDFVEIFNKSNKVLTTTNLMINNSMTGDIWVPVTGNKIIYPGDYVALTQDPENVIKTYRTHDSLQIIDSSIPSMGDQGACLQLAFNNNNQLVLLDSFTFSKDWHLPFIHDVEGVTLEKINMDSYSSNRNNWQSASYSSGYGTPGLANGQSSKKLKTSSPKPYTLSSQLISPNSDLENDFLLISFHLNKAGFKSRIAIYNLSGLEVKSISNQVLDAEDFIVWNGDDNNTNRIAIGNYILFIELLHPDGDLLQFKERVTVDY